MMIAGAAFTVLAAWGLGKPLLDRTAPKLDRNEAHRLAFVVGSVLLAAITALAQFGGPAVLAASGLGAVAVGLWHRGLARGRPVYASRVWRIPLAMIMTAFGVLYLMHAMMPEIAPDGRFHHLGDVVAASQHRALLWSPVQLVYLFAFTFGGHAAPALVHLVFLCALALLMAPYGRREGIYKAGVVAALMVFASPLAGLNGSTACEDAAVAALLFAAFYLRQSRLPALLAFAGAVLTIAAWHGPGRYAGMPGPGFLLIPLALVALRRPDGRLALAAGLALLWFGWMPALPFLALALGMALEGSRYVAPAVLALHTLLCWPDLARFYTPREGQIGHVSIRSALRLQPEDEFLRNNLPGYQTAQLVERLPHEAAVYSLARLPRAYLGREVVTTDEWNDVLRTPVTPELQPRVRLRLSWTPAQAGTLSLRGPGVIHELRLYDDGRELPRSGWRLSGEPPSPTVQNAFDNSPVTRWSGKAVRVAFGRPQRVSGAVIECPQAAGWRVELDGHPVEAASEASAAPPPPMRRMAVYELKARGIRYLLAPDDDPAAPDLLAYPEVWGLRLWAAGGGAHLFQLQ